MTITGYLFALIIWVIFAVVEFLDGILIRVLASPGLGNYGVHVTSTIRLFCFVIIMTYILIRSLDIRYCSMTDMLFIGLLWFVLSVTYRFVYSHYVRYYPWNLLLAEYNIFEGGLRGFILLAQLLTPYLLGRYSIRKAAR